MNAPEFLRLLWGDEPPGLIQLWRLSDRRSFYLRGAPAAAAYAPLGAPDVYAAVGLAGKDLGRFRRAKAGEIVAIAGLWLDIDVNGGPDDKQGAAPTQDDAIELARTGVVEPTVLVDSGYGIHAYWLFGDGPWRFASRDEQATAARMSIQWYALHHAQARGWGLDYTHDLSRLLRIPSTVNAKDPERPRPVRVISCDGPRFSRRLLGKWCAVAGDVGQGVVSSGMGMTGAGGALPDVVANAGGAPWSKIDALMVNVPEFRATWEHINGRPAWSTSEYDMSVASQAAAAGFTDQEIADTIVAHRHKWKGGDDRKAGRIDYLRRTVAAARAGATERAAA